MIRYYEENVEYLRTTGDGGFVVDNDVQQLGVSNRTRELLETCVTMLEQGENVDLASRVLTRYTELDHEQAADWREWLQAEGQMLRFDDNRGVFVRRE